MDSTHLAHPRGIGSDDAPMQRSRMENHPTLLVSWWCTGCALVLILVRLWGRCIRTEKLFMEDKIMALSIVPLFVRMALVDPIMLYGTNNVNVTGLSDAAIHHRELGSKLVLASRIFYALFIWMAKFTVSEYLRRLTSTFWTRAHQRILLGIRVFLAITFFAVVVATFGECQPVHRYWQVVPDPGFACRAGYAQLFVMSICDIITDFLLICFPIGIIVRSSMPLRRKISISALFGFSAILIVITAYRLSAIARAGGRQQLRTLWASLEILAAAAVSNALILGSFVRDRGVKKSKYKGPMGTLNSTAGSEPQSHLVRKMTIRHWGNDSDEDLFATLRGRLGSVCEEEAGMAPAPFGSGGRYRDLPSSSDSKYMRPLERFNTVEAEGMELMDVGGILAEPKDSTSTGMRKISDDSHTPLNSAWPGESSSTHAAPTVIDSPATSAAFDFADVGGLLARSPERAGSSSSGPVAVTRTPKPPTRPANAFSSSAPVRVPPPLSKNSSAYSAASASDRRQSVASSAQTEDSAADERAIALDMLAKIRDARARARSNAAQSDSLPLPDHGRLFGEARSAPGIFEAAKPG